jgi:transcription elongation factor SPT6
MNYVRFRLSLRALDAHCCIDLFLKNQLAANPGKSMYGFSLNRKKPGHFNLGFLASKTSTVQTWV